MRFHPRPARRLLVTVAGVATLVATTGCARSAGSASSTGTRRTATTVDRAAQLPDACSLVDSDTVAEVLGGKVVGGNQLLEHDGTQYANTCLWGQATGANGSIGVQVGSPDDGGHDMILNRSKVLEPALVSSVAPGAVSSMNVAVLPVGGMKGSTVFFQAAGVSVLVAVTGPNGNLGVAETVARTVYERLTA